MWHFANLIGQSFSYGKGEIYIFFRVFTFIHVKSIVQNIQQCTRDGAACSILTIFLRHLDPSSWFYSFLTFLDFNCKCCVTKRGKCHFTAKNLLEKRLNDRKDQKGRVCKICNAISEFRISSWDLVDFHSSKSSFSFLAK